MSIRRFYVAAIVEETRTVYEVRLRTINDYAQPRLGTFKYEIHADRFVRLLNDLCEDYQRIALWTDQA
jgi:hypothetical protein